jgi:type VI secretion system protein ImpB
MDNSQKLIGGDRAPRVQIEYDVEVYGESRQVELPFVMGVLSDLSGHAANHLPPLNQRNFVEIDSGNFNHRMREIGPELQLQVKNHLTGEGALGVDLKFRQMDDFRPDELARQVPALARLLDAREKLSSLLAYMDGKSGAEDLLKRILHDKPLLEQITNATDTTGAVDAQTGVSGTGDDQSS